MGSGCARSYVCTELCTHNSVLGCKIFVQSAALFSFSCIDSTIFAAKQKNKQTVHHSSDEKLV